MGRHALGRLDPGLDLLPLRRHGAWEAGVSGALSAHAVMAPDGQSGSGGRAVKSVSAFHFLATAPSKFCEQNALFPRPRMLITHVLPTRSQDTGLRATVYNTHKVERNPPPPLAPRSEGRPGAGGGASHASRRRRGPLPLKNLGPSTSAPARAATPTCCANSGHVHHRRPPAQPRQHAAQ